MKPDCPQDIAQLAALDIEHRIVVALNPPSDQPHRASAVLAAAHCIRLFLEPLELPNGELRDIRKALGRGDDALAPTGLQLRGRTSRYPAWRAALLVRTDSLEFVRRAFGAMLVEALLTDYPIGKTRASKLVTALQGRIDWAYLQRRIDSVHTLAGEDTRARLSLRERLRGHYRAPHGNPGEHAHQLRLDDRSLSPERYSIAARVIRSAVEAGETWACWSALGVVTGLPLDLVAALPIRSPCVANSECALLDLQRGQYHFDLTVIAPNPRTRPAPAIECIPATSYLTRPLPEFLCRALASTQDIRPTATSVEELLDTCPDRARDPCEGVFRGAIRPTLARLQN